MHPPDRPALLGAALRCLDAAAFGDAEALARHALAIDPSDGEALLITGLALSAGGHPERGVPILARIAEMLPDRAHPCRNLADLLSRIGRASEISGQYARALAFAPGDARLRLAYADHLHEAGATGDAIAMLGPALPGSAAAHNLMGILLYDLGRLVEAVIQFRRAIAVAPALAGGWTNLGMALKTAGRFRAAIAAHDQALARSPDDPQLRLNRAIALLRAGRFAEAWPDYECRLRVQGQLAPRDAAPMPRDITELAGRHILVSHEEGFGDTLQFARYLPMLAAAGATVLLRLPRELTRLFAGQPGFGRVLDPAAPMPPHDLRCAPFSLPRVFATTLEDIPAPCPYLHPDPALAATWAGRLTRLGLPATGRRIGLVWAGQARPWLTGFTALDRRRSLGLATLASLAGLPGIAWISLQKGPAAGEPPPPGLALIDPMPDAADFADTAAIIANLDAVISVDTAAAHLAAAMGKPVLLLDRYDSCWRWLAGRDDSPWYPTLRIFRQSRMGDWSGPIARVEQYCREALDQ